MITGNSHTLSGYRVMEFKPENNDIDDYSAFWLEVLSFPQLPWIFINPYFMLIDVQMIDKVVNDYGNGQDFIKTLNHHLFPEWRNVSMLRFFLLN